MKKVVLFIFIISIFVTGFTACEFEDDLYEADGVSDELFKSGALTYLGIQVQEFSNGVIPPNTYSYTNEPLPDTTANATYSGTLTVTDNGDGTFTVTANITLKNAGSLSLLVDDHIHDSGNITSGTFTVNDRTENWDSYVNTVYKQAATDYVY